MSQRIHQLLSADEWRRSRLHDMRGNFVGFPAVITDLPRSMVTAAVREATGRHPALPWIPYPAISAIDALVRDQWRVLEHGAGMSTIWWASRVSHVESIEANAAWHGKISAELLRLKRTNVHLSLRQGSAYSDLSSYADGTFDFIVIDGHDREKVAAQALRLLKRPGWIYFDNSDFAAQWHEMYGEAEDILLAVAERERATVSYFTGLTPGTVVASQGLLVSFP